MFKTHRTFLFALLLSAVSCTQHKKSIHVAMVKKTENAILCPDIREFGAPRLVINKKDTHYEAIEAVFQNKALVAAANTPSIFVYTLHKPQTRKELIIVGGVAALPNSFALMTKTSSGIDEPQKLRGKKIAHLGDETRFFKSYFLRTEGVDETKTKEIILNSPDKLVQALESGGADAIIIPSESAFKVTNKKYNVFFSKLHELTTQIITTRTKLRKHPNDIKMFFNVLIQNEKDIYRETESFINRAQKCLPETNINRLTNLIEERSFRVLLDKSLLTQYELYKEWNLLARKKDKIEAELIQNFQPRDIVEPSVLLKIDKRRVLIE